LGIGTIAGLLAVAPTLLTRFSGVPWQDLVTSLAGVGLTGLFAGLLTSSLALRAPIVETLKAEG
jgi:ABC-type antimicrobial peptide transport system permease subunit